MLFLLGNANDDNDNDTNTSVWLSDSTLADVETSSGVETATSSPPEAVPDEVVEAQQVRDSSKSVVALCDVSRISIVSTSSVPREQLSSLGGPGGPSSAAFHSTFNYPLHSTLRAAAAAASVRCPSPLPAESPVRPGSRDSEDGGGRRPRPTRQRDLPPAASTGCRRCRETTPLRRQHARARLERQAPLVPRRRPDVDHHDDVGSISVSLHATRGSLPDLEDLSTDSEEYCAPIEGGDIAAGGGRDVIAIRRAWLTQRTARVDVIAARTAAVRHRRLGPSSADPPTRRSSTIGRRIGSLGSTPPCRHGLRPPSVDRRAAVTPQPPPPRGRQAAFPASAATETTQSLSWRREDALAGAASRWVADTSDCYLASSS